ncbi:AAA family ATPase [Thalassoroseus pseudoceratinae]|uniref:AAA family ATPase n=1 Tax=Thalassoroseus pseudoceratinae TaxID=2713176 RepID=UPI001423165D|nr:MoxR family ATPase [Thalassoroseus pseudoceratinae]
METVVTDRTPQVVEDAERIDRLRRSLNSVLRGKADVVEQVLVCLLARGHLLIEDRPGLGKTTLAKALADAVGGRFARVQCTPDLLPSDITGFNIFNQKTREFEFRQGPVFADILLADEINRATPRTQSALLEAMAERQVTVDGERYRLADDFFVIATQNPHEHHGTYPLPEAQLDRFAMKLSIGYPAEADELQMLDDALDTKNETKSVQRVFDTDELSRMQRSVAEVHVAESVREYLVRLGNATRNHAEVLLGLSPRGLLIWLRAAQAFAWLRGHNFVTPDDIQDTAPHVLGVRLAVSGRDAESVIEQILVEVPVPDYRKRQ